MRDESDFVGRSGTKPVLDGKTLSIPAIVASARYNSLVELDESQEVVDAVAASRKVIDDKLAAATSIYGVSTGFGGSADTRTDQYDALGAALLEHHHSGVISVTPAAPGDGEQPLPYDDQIATTTMPIPWVRAAIAVRVNSVIRGHSGVRWIVIEQMRELLNRNLTPLAPLRGSISACGDLTPLAYLAGAVIKHPHIRILTPEGKIIRASETDLPKIDMKPKEQLGIMNGTAFSAAVGALAVQDSLDLAALSLVCTALGTEALLGTQASHAPFIHEECRPHPGQVEAARVIFALLEGSKLATTGNEREVSIEKDAGTLRQDRYPLRTSAQYLGPQLEDILSAYATLNIECNSSTYHSTDNPLIDASTGHVHHGGNFQAMAVTNAMEKTRLALFHIGKIIFAQATELLNPAFNRGLPPSVAATDPSTNYHAKGLDIAAAAYVSELGFLANPVGTHVQSAEMHNQAVNSLALISARATMTAIDILNMLFATYIYILCQAIDLRGLHAEFEHTIPATLSSLFEKYFSGASVDGAMSLQREILSAIKASLEASSTQDAADRMAGAARAAALPLYTAFPSSAAVVPSFVEALREALLTSYTHLRMVYLKGTKNGAHCLGHTRLLYEFVRNDLGVRIHGLANLRGFKGEGVHGVGERSIGESVSLIYEAIRDRRLQDALVKVFSNK
ncbi:phenylalanine ammonia-lyase [Auricularia subglabra TFB-10046 SS5]|uniref:Phenylalanine ammonia-lyase n=1 Tax=Auricularia subglabra (strain TFB-10046 / SS5) TaxID=717982 RepID=J0D9W9_AURST|nr:phenylalanine ammonia-lyase [Auricularia subglabra TFB-10046 SS5]